MFEDAAEKVWGHLGRAFAIGGGEAVLARAADAANGQARTGAQAQCVAGIIETEGVGKLGKNLSHDLTPAGQRAGIFFEAVVSGQLGHEMSRNHIAELAQEGEAAARWLGGRLFFIPDLVVGFKPASQLFLPHQTFNAGGHL